VGSFRQKRLQALSNIFVLNKRLRGTFKFYISYYDVSLNENSPLNAWLRSTCETVGILSNGLDSPRSGSDVHLFASNGSCTVTYLGA
jgi:hypothetical protein